MVLFSCPFFGDDGRTRSLLEHSGFLPAGAVNLRGGGGIRGLEGGLIEAPVMGRGGVPGRCECHKRERGKRASQTCAKGACLMCWDGGTRCKFFVRRKKRCCARPLLLVRELANRSTSRRDS